jgi:hypothetical protein
MTRVSGSNLGCVFRGSTHEAPERLVDDEPELGVLGKVAATGVSILGSLHDGLTAISFRSYSRLFMQSFSWL